MTKGQNNSEARGGVLKALALVAGLACSAGLANVALLTPSGMWLGWVMLIPLLLAIRMLSPLRALLAGAFWGACLFAFASIADVAPFSLSTAALLRLAIVPGVYAWLGSLLTRRNGFSPLLLGLGWVGVELALHPLGIQNGLLAGTQEYNVVVRTLGLLAGSVVVAFVVVYVNASILSMLAGAATVPGGSRRAPRSSAAEVRWSIPESPAFLFAFLRNRHARAPPAH